MRHEASTNNQWGSRQAGSCREGGRENALGLDPPIHPPHDSSSAPRNSRRLLSSSCCIILYILEKIIGDHNIPPTWGCLPPSIIRVPSLHRLPRTTCDRSINCCCCWHVNHTHTAGIKVGALYCSLGIFKVYSSVVYPLSVSRCWPPGSSPAKGMECGRLSLNANHKLLEAFVSRICQNLCHLCRVMLSTTLKYRI